MALISFRDLRIAFGGRPLLDDASLQIERGERIGLLGRNGEGKSTLLKILVGDIMPDDGTIVRESGLRTSLLSQQPTAGLPETVDGVIREGLHGQPEADHPVQRLASLLDLDTAALFDTLSGGQKRRALLGRALAAEPQLLLLDEPTNHLDIESIEWLENFLLRFAGSILFVTHDRAFLQRLATRIIELDRGRLTSWECDYQTYLARKEELLANEEKAWNLFDKKLAAEEVWIRTGIQARRTRNEGRVRALEQLRVERADRRDRIGRVRINIQQAERSGTRVITTENVDFGYNDTLLIRNLTTTIMRGERVGIMGPNGAGKTTLINLLLGRLAPQRGAVKHGTALKVAYFDQHREQLDGDATVADSVADGADHVLLDGERKHIMGYLQDFLFSPERARQPVRSLSGGERNRLLLARLFTQPANMLVLDEPTNDLDAETLELLESRLLDYTGTVLIVSHDRSFLDNLCTSTLVFEGRGIVKEYVGGYSDWKRAAAMNAHEVVLPALKKVAPKPLAKVARPRKLSYTEKQELESLPARIEALEQELTDLHAAMADPASYRGEADVIRAATDRAKEIENEIEAAFIRWSDLGALT